MAEKIAKLGIKRDDDFMYYIKKGEVWRVARKKPGEAKLAAEKVADAGIEMDSERYLYFLDADGDLARQRRQAAPGGDDEEDEEERPDAPAPAAEEPAGWFPGLPPKQ